MIYTTQDTMPVPLSFGVGDIVAVGSLVRNIYATYAGAPEQFRNVSPEILSLYVVVQKVEDHLGIWRSGGLPGSGGLARLDESDLKTMYDELRIIMEELDDPVKRYQCWASSERNPIDHFSWGQKNLVGLRERLRSSTNTFIGSLAKYVDSPLTNIDFRNATIFLYLPMYLLSFKYLRLCPGNYLAANSLRRAPSAYSYGLPAYQASMAERAVMTMAMACLGNQPRYTRQVVSRL